MRKLKVRVYHEYYGCDTGCCGHIVEVTGDGEKERSHFDFGDAPYKATPEEEKVWARELAEEIIKKNWPECLDSIDWGTLDVSEISGIH